MNWGKRVLSEPLKKQLIAGVKVLNKPECVATAGDKLKFFRAIKEQMEWPVRVPDWTEDIEVAKSWARSGVSVVCRTILNGHSGAGIVLAEKEADVVAAPLYTKYINKKDEYRVHVFNGEVLHVSRKARNRDIPDENVNWKIRNHDNGFIFQHSDFVYRPDVTNQAMGAIAAIGLDFGAVDVVFNDRYDMAYVLEVNTAPGIEGITLEKYSQALSKLVE